MKFLVKSKIDNPPPYGDRMFRKGGKPLKKGDEIEISGAGFELVMSETSDYRRRFGETFELVREVPESPEEKERAKPRLLKAELMGEKKTDLAKEAKGLGLPTNLNKEDLADEIVEAKTTEVITEAVQTPLTAAEGAENPKAKRPTAGGKK